MLQKKDSAMNLIRMKQPVRIGEKLGFWGCLELRGITENPQRATEIGLLNSVCLCDFSV